MHANMVLVTLPEALQRSQEPDAASQIQNELYEKFNIECPVKVRTLSINQSINQPIQSTHSKVQTNQSANPYTSMHTLPNTRTSVVDCM
jgi:hypothetical protein